MTRIGVGGLLNMDKLKQAHVVLSDIALFHSHGQRRREEDDHRYKYSDMSSWGGMGYGNMITGMWPLGGGM